MKTIEIPAPGKPLSCMDMWKAYPALFYPQTEILSKELFLTFLDTKIEIQSFEIEYIPSQHREYQEPWRLPGIAEITWAYVWQLQNYWEYKQHGYRHSHIKSATETDIEFLTLRLVANECLAFGSLNIEDEASLHLYSQAMRPA